MNARVNIEGLFFSDDVEMEVSAFDFKSDDCGAPAFQDLAERWVRRDILGPEFLREATWTILLHLYLDQRWQRKTRSKELIATTFLSEATLARELDRLEESGIVERTKEGPDTRVTWTRLTSHWVSRLNLYFAARYAFEQAPVEGKRVVVAAMKSRNGIDVPEGWEEPFYTSDCPASTRRAVRTLPDPGDDRAPARERGCPHRTGRTPVSAEQGCQVVELAPMIPAACAHHRSTTPRNTRWH